MKGIEDEIRKHEGFVDGFYLDSRGKLTSGYGHLVDLKNENVPDEVLNLTNKFNKDPRIIEAEKKVSKAKTKKEKDAAKAAREKVYNKVSDEINKQDFGMKAIKSEDSVARFEVSYKVNLDEIEQDFKTDVAEKGIARAKKNFKDYDKYPENVQRALVNMSYQLGNSPASWPSFNAALTYGLKTGDYTHAAYHASDSQWFENQTPKRAAEVVAQIGSIAKEPLDRKTMDAYKGPIVPAKEEREVPQVEEQGFLEQVGDFFLDTFGIGAEASEVPPMETLQEPQEEVPMSPTDAMRAKSQGRVILDSAQSVPTNPEAGPSDTVPAMLTPGEAVIPAAAAQDPENIPVIEKMIDEGRAKNRMAEANGVPVNGKEATMYDDAELDAYHKRNKTGKYGGGEMSLQGFAGGVMEVPSMMMMAPPKDPAMDQMEKLAVKQMGYEQKSKNRTRDTIEKIGLKHLEDTANANMKQAALDETMKNYGMEVPMPMQPVPQGFQDGTPGLYDERPELSFAQTALSGLAGPATGLYDNKTDADLAEISRFSPVAAQSDAAQRELARRQAEIPTGAEVIQIDPVAPIKIAGSEATITPPQPVPLKTLVEAPTKEEKTPNEKTTGGGFLSGLGKALGSAFKSAAKSVFDPESIATAGIYYGVNRLLGYNDATAAKQAAIGYNAGQQQRAAKLKVAADLLAKKETTQAQRDKEDIANQTKLRNAAESQFNKAFEQTLTKEGSRAAYGTTPEALTGEVVAALRTQGVDMSDPLQVEYAMNLVPSVVQQYKEGMQRGEEILSVQDAFDRVFRSKLEVSDALSVKDDEGIVTGVVKSGVTAPLFNQIRKNISNANTPEGQAEFESRLSTAYKLFQERKDELNLPAPGSGENEFTVFLRTVLGQGTIRDFAK